GGDRLGRKVVETDDRLGERVEQRPPGRRLRQPLLHPLEEGVEVTPHDVVLRREVPEERAAGDTGGGGDVVERRLVESVADEEVERHLLEVGPARDRRSPESV